MQESMGFWAVLIARAAMTRTPPCGGKLALLTSYEARLILGRLLTEYLTDSQGLSLRSVGEVYQSINPDRMWFALHESDDIVSVILHSYQVYFTLNDCSVSPQAR